MDTQTKVAYACNILSMEGHTDTIYGHVSARVENAEQIWMKLRYARSGRSTTA